MPSGYSGINKFEHPAQCGGILTGTIDHPQPCGGQSCRVAFVDTGAGLRFVVALDRGGDIVQAAWNEHNLAFLTPNGYKPPNPAYNVDEDWLNGWPGGLVTTCGPAYIGGPRIEDQQQTSLHGHYSNIPAAVESIINPDPQRGRLDMSLTLVIRDSRFYGPTYEIRRVIRCTLGQPTIDIADEVTNRCDTKRAHNWLYHCNLGYPLLDEGSRFIYRGKAELWQPEGVTYSDAQLMALKTASGPRDDRTGSLSDVFFIEDDQADADGLRHVGLVNDKLGFGLELAFPLKELPRLGNWQHFGPRGAYVTGLEPFNGSLVGKDNESHPKARVFLKPGESKQYHLTLRVLRGKQEIAELEQFDGVIGN